VLRVRVRVRVRVRIWVRVRVRVRATVRVRVRVRVSRGRVRVRVRVSVAFELATYARLLATCPRAAIRRCLSARRLPITLTNWGSSSTRTLSEAANATASSPCRRVSRTQRRRTKSSIVTSWAVVALS
jgi:hypothetical protein